MNNNRLFISRTDHNSQSKLGPNADPTNWARVGSNVDFRGAHDRAQRYSYGDLTTASSQIWICNVNTIAPNSDASTDPGGSANSWLSFGGSGTSTPTYDEVGFPEFAAATADEYTTTHRDNAENAVWTSFPTEEVVGGTLITATEFADGISRRRLRMTNAGTVTLTATRIQDTIDSRPDNQFPVKVLLQRGVAGNLNIGRTARVMQGGQSLGTKSFAFLRNQTREMVITRTSGTGTNSVYNIDVIDGISSSTMVGKVRMSSTGFRVLAYLLARFYTSFRGEWGPDGIYKKSEMTSNSGRLFVSLVNNGPSDTPPIDSLAWEPADSNMSYRGPFVLNTGHYRLGDTTLDNGMLFMLIAANLINSTTPPSADTTNWIRISSREATEAEVTTGTAGVPYVSPRRLAARIADLVASLPAGSVEYADADETKALTIENKAVNPRGLREVLEAFARAAGSYERGLIPHDRLAAADLWVDNGGLIQLADGFIDFLLFYKRRTDVGHGNQGWFPLNLNTIFEIVVSTVGIGQNAQHNYGLKFIPGIIRKVDIRDILDLNNLLGIVFPQYPSGTVSNGDPLVPRPVTSPPVSWIAGDDPALNDTFTKSGTEVKISIGNKRNAATRGITHLLVRAGRVSGIGSASTRTSIIQATRSDSAVYQEVHLPLSVAQSFSESAPTSADEYMNYAVTFANTTNSSCNLRVEQDISNGQSVILARARHGADTTGFNGTEFLAIYGVRGFGG